MRARIAAVLFGGALLTAVLLSAEPGWMWRGLTGALALVLAWRPVRNIIFGWGATAVRRVEWSANGRWQVSDAAGRTHTVELSATSATFGRWLLLVWKTPGRDRLHALIDCACSDPQAFRALKGRLNC